MNAQRVVITGLGCVSPLGQNTTQYWDALVNGRSGIRQWSSIDPRIIARVGGDMTDFDLDGHMETLGKAYPEALCTRARKALRATPLAGRLTAIAAMQAFVEARLLLHDVNPHRIGHVLGGHNLNLRYQSENCATFNDEPDFIDPLFGLMGLDTDVLSVTSELLGIKGPTMTVGAACASGNLALMAGLDLIRCGRADVVLVTGAAMDLDSVWLQAWTIMEALAFKSFNDQPTLASRPFDAKREGFVPSEGSGAIILESAAHAEKRDARVRAELLGVFATSAASRSTRPDFDTQVLAMRGAFADAGVEPSDIDYVNAHATSTPMGDAVEVSALKEALGKRAQQIPVNATKSMLGHCLTSASVLEMIATVLQVEHGVVHPTINLTNPDPELGLDFVREGAREHRIDVAMSNAFGFGGLNSSAVVRRWS
jgi:3-oxoacyl-(acyl-carrier-protein) synthase